jgi:predicted transcriptional regulator of viral defense system
MKSVVEHLKQANYTNRVFNERQLGDLLGGSDARRYGLVSRALKDGSLVRIKRGVYTLPQRHRSVSIHPFAVAQALLPGSYISFETALAFHGWIPEAVYTTASVTPARKTLTYDTDGMGRVTFSPLAINPYQFLVGVERRKVSELTAFVASPLRALLDLVALRKARWSGLDWITQGMRIDEDSLLNLERSAFDELRPVYKHKGVRAFLEKLQTEVSNLNSSTNGRTSND